MTWAGFGRLERLSLLSCVLHTRLRAERMGVGEVGEVPLQKQLCLLAPAG